MSVDQYKKEVGMMKLEKLIEAREGICDKPFPIPDKELLSRFEQLYLGAVNDVMREALREMFDKAHAVYEANKGFGEDVEVEACCYLSNDYPALHPVQGENRQELWNALQDSGWNLLYEGGVAFPLQLKGNDDPDSNDFDEFIGMNCPPPNWNEGLDQELTKDLHLIQAFHNLFDHTDFAITDFIYCRDFYYEIKVEFRNEAQQSH